MAMKEKFNRGATMIKNGVTGAVKGAFVVAVAVPTLGLLAHIAPTFGDVNLGNDYSLKNRFETAYSFNTPEQHKYYHATPVVNGYNTETTKERYMASPYATYGVIALGAMAGAAGAVAFAEEKRKQNQR